MHDEAHLDAGPGRGGQPVGQRDGRGLGHLVQREQDRVGDAPEPGEGAGEHAVAVDFLDHGAEQRRGGGQLAGVDHVQGPVAVKRVRRIDRDYRTRPAGSAYAEQMEQVGLRPRTKLDDVGIVTPPAEIAEALKLSETDQTVMRHRLMYADDVAVQVATSYIPVDFAGGADIAYPDTGPSGIYARLDQRGHGPVRFAEDIEVRRPTEDEALILRIPEGQPVLEILRTAYAADDRPVEACSNVLAAYQWRLTYRWSQGADIEPEPTTLPSGLLSSLPS